MVQKKEEMTDSGLNSGKKVSLQEKGRKNKRKLADPSQQNAANHTASLTEFPRYELHLLKAQNPLSDHGSIGTVSVEDSESVGWDDPLACHLEELLMSNLLTLFRNAIKQIVDCGYREDVALKSITGSGLYCGGNDLVSNVVNDTLRFLKNGKECTGPRDCVFEDLQQLVVYTLIEMTSLLREVRPSLSTVEAMWRLLICDLNVLQACEMDGDGIDGSSSSDLSKSSEALDSESNSPKSGDPDALKPPQSNCQNNKNEPLKFGSVPNLSNSKNPRASGTKPEKEVFPGSIASGEGAKSTSLTSVTDDKLVSGRKGRSKKELAILRQKSCVEKIRTYNKGSGYKTAKFASVGGFLVEKRGKSPSDLVAVQARNSSSKMTAEIGGKVPLADGSSTVLNNNTKSDSPAMDTKDYVTALPAADTNSATPALPDSEKKYGPESEGNVSVSAKLVPDYYTGIPYDASLGVYVPSDKKDELILKLVPRVKDLQNELQIWTDWANQKVKQATYRLFKDQPELKALRKEKEEAEQYKKEKQLLEENAMKRLSEMEFALNNATNQLEKANNTVHRLELEQSLLKKEMEAAKIRAVESAESCREAKERGHRALKNAQSWEGQKILLQDEFKSQRDKVTELQREVDKAKNHQNQIEATWKREKAAKEKLMAQATAIKKEREQVEASGKAEEERIKTKAENDMKYYIENVKRLESEISKLKLKSDWSKIAALKKGVDKSGIPETETLGNAYGAAKVKRERECVMCLCDEMSVIFLPCAHQVLCSKCNQLHEKEGMKDCPSCRATIQRRVQARFARA